MDTVDLSRFVFAFVFVLGLIGLLNLFLRRYSGAKKFFGVQEGSGRVKIIEAQYLDHKRRLLLVRRDDVEHLILLADGRETIIESGIKAPKEPHV